MMFTCLVFTALSQRLSSGSPLLVHKTNTVFSFIIPTCSFFFRVVVLLLLLSLPYNTQNKNNKKRIKISKGRGCIYLSTKFTGHLSYVRRAM